MYTTKLYKRKFKENSEKKENITRIIEGRITDSDILSLVNPWGASDVDTASETATRFKLDFDDIEDYFEVLGGASYAENIDPVFMVYKVGLDEASSDIDDYIDEYLNELVYVVGNYIATSWDVYSSGDDKKLEVYLNKITPKDAKRFSKTTKEVLKDIVDQLGIEVSWLK